jgi:transcription antitermination factor NusG
MGAAVAIQVKTGMEMNVKKMIDWAVERNDIARNTISAVHTFSQMTQRLVKGGLGKQVTRMQFPGYIFIEMISGGIFPAELWHLIKGVPGVLKLMADAGHVIEEDVFHELVGKINSEDQIEVSVPIAETNTEKKHALIKFNQASNVGEKREVEASLREIEARQTITEQLEEVMGKHTVQPTCTSQSLLQRCKVLLKEKKEILRCPISIFRHLMGYSKLGQENRSLIQNFSNVNIPLVIDIIGREVKRE